MRRATQNFTQTLNPNIKPVTSAWAPAAHASSCAPPWASRLRLCRASLTLNDGVPRLKTLCVHCAAEDLRRVFIDFASFGSRQAFADMDGAKFFKLCKDTRLVTRAFTVIDVDIIFAKARDQIHLMFG